MAGGRLRILGTAPVAVAPRVGMKRRHDVRDEVDSDSMEEDDEVDLGAIATWNIFFDIDLLR